jgi:hypothetical protein
MYPNDRGNFRASPLISFDPFVVFGIFFSNTNILYCFHGAFELTPYVSHKIRFSL